MTEASDWVKNSVWVWIPASLPFLIDGVHKLTQSNAILPSIAHKHSLCGEKEEKILMDILKDKVMDIWMYNIRVCYNPDFEKLKPEFF